MFSAADRTGRRGRGHHLAYLSLPLIWILAACSPAGGGSSQPVASQEVGTPSPSTSASSVSDASAVDVTVLPEDVLRFHLFSSLPASTQERLSQMDAMDLEEFRAQPASDQLFFADYILDNNREITSHRLKKVGIIGLDDAPDSQDPEDVYKQQDFKFALLSTLKEMNADGVAFDSLTAKKTSVLVANPAELERQGYIDSRIDEWGVNTSTSMIIDRVTASKVDEGRVIRINAESPSGDKSYNVLSLKKFTNYLGQDDQMYTTDLSVIGTDVRYTDLSK